MAKYRNIKEIGSGGFGKVWQCQRVEDNRNFAKKELKTDDEEAINRFAREVRITSSLDHPNIIKIIAKRLETPPYFYISPLYNHSLHDEIPNIVSDQARIFKIFSAILDGIEYAHSQGVIHRDLKPENILLNSDFELVISDFGLGRYFDAVTTRQTLTGEGLGTPMYMAPEQILNAKDADHRSDVYSLGRILYELYVGLLSFGIQDNSELPSAVQVIVSRCVKGKPEERYQSVKDLKQDWLSIFDLENYEEELEEFAILCSNQSLDKNEVKRLIELFPKHIPDDDSLHDILIKTDAEALTAMYEYDSGFVKRIINDFCNFTSAQGWGFDYTDKIGNWCNRVFMRIDDPEIRTDLVSCVLVVGVWHNRWNVLDRFSKMIIQITDAGEIILLKSKLENIPESTRHNAIGYIDIGKIAPKLRGLFEVGD